MDQIGRWRLVAASGVLALVAACGSPSEQDQLSAARAHLEKGDANAAVIGMKALLEKNQASPEARTLLGMGLLAQSQPALAAVELGKALDLNALPARVLPEYARALLESGQYKKVIELGGRTLDDAGAQAELRASVAAAHLGSGELEQARQVADAVLSSNPRHTAALLVKARILATNRDYVGARSVVDQALQIDPKLAKAWKLQGDLQALDAGSAKAAVESFRKASSLQPAHLEHRVALVAQLLRLRDVPGAKTELSALKADPRAKGQASFLDAQLALAEGDLARAHDLVTALLRAAPDDGRILQLAGAVALRRGDAVAAETHLARAMALQPGSLTLREMLASAQLQRGQAARALATLQPVLADRGTHLDALVVAAESHMLLGDTSAAESFYLRAAKASPDDLRVRTALAVNEISQGRTESGITKLQRLAADDKGTSVDMSLIAILLQRRDIEGALKAIAALEQKQPGSPNPPTLRARVQLLRGDMSGARASYLAALKLSADHFPAVLGLATLDMREGKLPEAASRFEALVKSNPSSAEAYLALAEIRNRLGAKREDVFALLQAAVKAAPLDRAARLAMLNYHFGVRDFRAALTTAQEAVAQLPASPEFLYGLAKAQLATGDLQQAVTTFGKVAALQPKSPTPHVRMAEAYLSKGNAELAVRNFKRALELDPGSIDAQRGLVRLAMKQRRTDVAVAAARDLQKRGPDHPAGYMLEGDVQAEAKAWSSAIDAYRNGLKRVPASADLAIRLHATMAAAGRGADASAFAASWIKDHPRDAPFVFYLGDVSMAKRDYVQAEEHYRRVLSIAPNNPMAHNNIAWLLARAGKRGASEHARKALALLGDSPAVLDTLAAALAAEGDLPKAIEASQRAVALGPEVEDLRINLVRLFLKAKNKDGALAELKPLMARGTASPRSKEIAQLQSMATKL